MNQEQPSPTKTSLSQDELNVKLHPLGIYCFAFSPDQSMIAISVKDENKVLIYQVSKDLHIPREFKLLYTLKEHSLPVSTLDWSIKNQILTGSYDRNVVVWHLNKELNRWDPELVITVGQKRAVLGGCWSNDGNKFAVGTATKRAYIGYYEASNKWWNSYTIKGFLSSVLDVKFHSSGRVVACASADHTVKLVTCYIQEIDDANPVTGAFSNIKSNGEVLWVVKDAGGWVESLAFSPDYRILAFAVHDGSLHYVELGEDGIPTDNTFTTFVDLPLKSIAFVSNTELLAASHDKFATIYVKEGAGPLKKGPRLENAVGYPNGVKIVKSDFALKKNLFESGQRSSKIVAPSKQFHSNPILCLRQFQGRRFASCDIHGNFFFWDI
eukprot:TRINITY_DN9229_c0_g1_i1.p1 TRINITY_DN9229_c0_g1~~TRINITY_DN9229_c0_g1_i1.p1  ORF type:complete len:382 (-),score=60.09 TRINITY_DN9229_c0_g1_i1:137-1282(-)